MSTEAREERVRLVRQGGNDPVPSDDLASVLAGAALPASGGALLVGPDDGDDAGVVFLDGSRALVTASSLCAPVVDDPGTWGRVAAAHALGDVWAMGGRPVVALDVLLWPRTALPASLASEVLRGGAATCTEAGCVVVGGHTSEVPDAAGVRYGLSVTGTVAPDRVLRHDTGLPGVPLTLTKPVGTGLLLERHRADGHPLDEAVASMTTLLRDAATRAAAGGARCAGAVGSRGLLGRLAAMVRASRCGVVLESGAVPVLTGVREAVAAGHVPAGTRRNLDDVRRHLVTALPDEALLPLTDVETSGGLLVAGELPGHPVVGRLVPDPTSRVTVV